MLTKTTGLDRNGRSRPSNVSSKGEDNQPPRTWRSFGAVLAGFFTVFVLSLVTDQVLHIAKFYPPWGEPMWDPFQNTVALSYRCIYTILGGYLTAKFSPRRTMADVWALAVLGIVMGTLGAVGSWNMKLGPHWYPVAIALTAVPLTLVGGALYFRKSGR